MNEKFFERPAEGFVEQSMKADVSPNHMNRKRLLREFFLNATLIALINELGRETARLEGVRDQLSGAGGSAGNGERPPIPAA